MKFVEIVKVQVTPNATRDYTLVVCKSPNEVNAVLREANKKNLLAEIVSGSVTMAKDQIRLWRA